MPGEGGPADGWTWTARWDDLAWLRHLVKVVSSWSVPCSSPFAVALHPSEWEIMGGGGRAMVFMGTDATMWSYCAINWTAREYIQGYLTGAERNRIRLDTRRRAPGARAGPFRGSRRNRDAVYMGVVELAAVVYGALRWAHGWRDTMVVAITDSTNAMRWIRRGKSRNGYAAYLLRVLAVLQLRYGFSLWAEYVGSDKNDMPDCGSRSWREDGSMDEKEAERWDGLMALMPEPLTRVELSEDERQATAWMDLASWESRALTICWRGAEGLGGPLEIQRTGGGGVAVGGRSGARTEAAAKGKNKYKGGAPVCDRRAARYMELLVRTKLLLLEEALAASTNEKYRRGFNHWRQFCHDTSRCAWLTGANRAEDEETLILFAVDQGVLQGLRHGTVTGKLSAVGYSHLQAGLTNPVQGKQLLKYVLRALRRRQGEAAPKQPVTPDLLRRVREGLDLAKTRDKALWAGMLMGFGFLMRASEYLAHEASGEFEMEKVIRWEDVTFRRDGVSIKVDDKEDKPDEVVVRFRSSKTDMFKSGCVRNLFVTGLGDLCPVSAMWDWALACSNR